MMEGKTIIWTLGIFLLLTGIAGGIYYGIEKTEDQLKYVSSTEYIAGDEGQTIVRLTTFQGNPIVATCTDTILYPDKSVFVSGTAMTSDGYGNYYHNFTVPSQEGVYTTNVNCTYGSRKATASKTFHISLLNSVMQQNFDALNVNITQNHLETLAAINDSHENLSAEIIQNRVEILNVQNNLSNQITSFAGDIQQNFSTVINLINQLNDSQTAGHDDLLAILLAINSTTSSTQTELSTFHTETTNNFISINNTVIGIKDDTEEILSKLDNFTVDINITLSNLTDQIEYLINLTENNIEMTQDNFSTVIDLIYTLNQTLEQKCDDLTDIFLSFNFTMNQKLDWIMNITNITEYEVRLLLIYHNVSFEDINLFPESNNCWVGGQWVIFNQVLNHFGVPQTNTQVWCNITTDNWGGPIAMNWDASRTKFKYTHLCDIAGAINWTIQCDYI